MKNRFTSRHLWCRIAGPIAILVAVVALPSCGEDNASGLPPVQRSVIVVGVEPNPVVGEQNFLTGSVSAAFVIRIRELAGLGGTVLFTNSTVFDPETGLQVGSPTFFDSNALNVFVGRSRIEPSGELEVTQTVNYTLTDETGRPDFRVDAHLSVAVQFQDDRGSVINRSLLVPVVPLSPGPQQ